MWKRAYNKGYNKGLEDGANLAIEVMQEVIKVREWVEEDDVCACSPGGTDCGDD